MDRQELEDKYFNNSVSGDFFDTFVGKQIGRGAGRSVFACKHDEDVVCKIEAIGGSFQNVIENEIWDELQYSDHAKWLAPVLWISPNGNILIQRRTELIPKKKYPDKVPHWFTDTKYENFGMLNGKFVCHDYGTQILTSGVTKRMVKADWWDG